MGLMTQSLLFYRVNFTEIPHSPQSEDIGRISGWSFKPFKHAATHDPKRGDDGGKTIATSHFFQLTQRDHAKGHTQRDRQNV